MNYIIYNWIMYFHYFLISDMIKHSHVGKLLNSNGWFKECKHTLHTVHAFSYFTCTVTHNLSMLYFPFIYETLNQGVSQDLEIGCPNLLEISKQGVQIVHLQYFSDKIGCPKDTQTPLWLIIRTHNILGLVFARFQGMPDTNWEFVILYEHNVKTMSNNESFFQCQQTRMLIKWQ